jgi:catechol 2,3-dioxygenase-like lactoylglutathione lyase family enzyme
MSLSRYKVAAGVAVSDMDRAREFYEGKLGLLVSIDSGDNLQSIRIVALEKFAGSSPAGHPPVCSKRRKWCETRHSHRTLRYGRRRGRSQHLTRVADALEAPLYGTGLELTGVRRWPLDNGFIDTSPAHQ